MDIRYRMYLVAEHHLSQTQKVIQGTHALVEYQLMYGVYGTGEDYLTWANRDKTIVCLDGGNWPELQADYNRIKELGIPVAKFEEPDMNGLMTAYAVLASEFVWDRKAHPDLNDDMRPYVGNMPDLIDAWFGSLNNLYLRDILMSKRLA